MCLTVGVARPAFHPRRDGPMDLQAPQRTLPLHHLGRNARLNVTGQVALGRVLHLGMRLRLLSRSTSCHTSWAGLGRGVIHGAVERLLLAGTPPTRRVRAASCAAARGTAACILLPEVGGKLVKLFEEAASQLGALGWRQLLAVACDEEDVADRAL